MRVDQEVTVSRAAVFLVGEVGEVAELLLELARVHPAVHIEGTNNG